MQELEQPPVAAWTVNGTIKGRANLKTALPVTAIGLLIASQMFDYKNLDFLVSRVVFAVTPDRILFLYLLFKYGGNFLRSQPGKRSNGRSELYLLVAFGLLCTFSWVITGRDFGNARYRWLASLFNLIYFPLGVYLIVKNTEYNRTTTIKLLRVVTGIGTYLCLTGMCEHFGFDRLVWPKYILDPGVGIQFGRVRGPFASSVPMGEWLIVVFLSACLLMQFADQRSKIYLGGLILFSTLGIYLTDTRGVWLSFGAVLLTTMIFGGKFAKQSFSIAALIFLGFFLGFGSKFAFGQKTLFSKRQETIDYRLANYQTDIKMGMSNFLTGVGYGNFVYEWQDYFGPEQQALVRDLTDGNHNTYLGLFAEVGFFGMLLYVLLLVSLAVKCFHIWRDLSEKEDFERNFAVAALSLVAVIMIEGVFGDQRFDAPFNTMLFLFVGIAVSMWAAKVGGKPTSDQEQLGPPHFKSLLARGLHT